MTLDDAPATATPTFFAPGATVFDPHAGDFAVLDQVHAALVCPARVAPGHSIVPDRAAARLHQGALDREAGVVEVEPGIHLADLVAVQKPRIRAVQDHRIAAPRGRIALRVGVDQVDDPALADHGVVVEILLQPLPQFQAELVERFVAIQQVVRPDDRGVAAHVAAAEVAFFQDRDAGLAEFLGKVVGRGQPVAATADDDVVVLSLGGRVAPDGFPAFVAGQ
jgi:hypothetical protein